MNPKELLKEKGWEKIVQDTLKDMIDEFVEVLRQDYQEADAKKDGADDKEGDGTQIRTYVNNVTIKALTSDITKNSSSDSKNQDFIEQKFRITKDVTWIDLLNEAKDFWGLNEEDKDPGERTKYSLMLPNNHDIMSLNSEETHIAHTVASYFEIHRAKRAVLTLKRYEPKKTKLTVEELTFSKVRNAVRTTRFKKDDTRTPEQIEADQKKKNLSDFVKKYPGLEDELISNMDQFDPNYKDKMSNILKNPDMSFCNFFISMSMFLLSLITFYSHRDFNSEYFNRQLIYVKLMDNPLGFQNYDVIKNVEDFKFFMNQTVAV